MTAIDPALFEGYLVRTRWFGGKGRPFRVTGTRPLGVVPASLRGPEVAVHLVTVVYDDAEGGDESYQVPLAVYDEIEERIGHAYLGSVDVDGHVRHLYDAVHDRDAMTLWLDGFIAAEGAGGVAEVGGLTFHRVPHCGTLSPALRSSTMTGEQSNSSVRFDDVAIMKVFRKVSPGVNPDIEIHDELTRGGSEYVAGLYGWVEAGLDGARIQLAMMQEFLRTATDGFELATGSVRTLLADLDQSARDSGGDFAGEAARLGEALAEVHAVLRERFPAERVGAPAIAELVDSLTERLEGALRAVPALQTHATRLREMYARVARLDGLDVQRVHGDLHLGQTLRTTHGWRIVDFEGEPGRPFAERGSLDSPWRDVAGMLRSFDYAPGVVEMAMSSTALSDPERALRVARAGEWSARAKSHFVTAYAGSLSGIDGPDVSPGSEPALPADLRALLDAYVADKAVYEVVYETRNRPAWAAIPLAALAGLTHE